MVRLVPSGCGQQAAGPRRAFRRLHAPKHPGHAQATRTSPHPMFSGDFFSGICPPSGLLPSFSGGALSFNVYAAFAGVVWRKYTRARPLLFICWRDKLGVCRFGGDGASVALARRCRAGGFNTMNTTQNKVMTGDTIQARADEQTTEPGARGAGRGAWGVRAVVCAQTGAVEWSAYRRGGWSDADRVARHGGGLARFARGEELGRAVAFWHGWVSAWRAGDAGCLTDSLWLAESGAASIAACLVSGATIGAPGGLLADIQGQHDLHVCRQSARVLLQRMRRDKPDTSAATADAGAADAVAFLAMLRAGGWCFNVRLAAWQAVSASMSSDTSAATVELSTVPDILTELRGQSLPLPALVGDDSRGDKASRLLFERARAKRPALLLRRVASLEAATKHHARKASILRVGLVASGILNDGLPLEQAASASGFKSSGKFLAGHNALRAALNIVGDGQAAFPRGVIARAWLPVRRGWPVVAADDLRAWFGHGIAGAWRVGAGVDAGGFVEWGAAWCSSSAPLVFTPRADTIQIEAAPGDWARGGFVQPELPLVSAGVRRDILTAADVRRAPWIAARVFVVRPWLPSARGVVFTGAPFVSALRARRAARAAAILDGERAHVARLVSAPCVALVSLRPVAPQVPNIPRPARAVHRLFVVEPGGVALVVHRPANVLNIVASPASDDNTMQSLAVDYITRHGARATKAMRAPLAMSVPRIISAFSSLHLA